MSRGGRYLILLDFVFEFLLVRADGNDTLFHLHLFPDQNLFTTKNVRNRRRNRNDFPRFLTPLPERPLLHIMKWRILRRFPLIIPARFSTANRLRPFL